MKRFFAYPLVRLAIIVLLFAGAVMAIQVAAGKYRGPWTSMLVESVLGLVLLAVIIAVERATTGRLPAGVGFDPNRFVGDTLRGLALGAGAFGTVALILALTGHYRVVAYHVTSSLWAAASFFFAGAILEELLFRGVIFRLTEESAGLWVALAVSAAFFGAAHAFNPGATWVSSLAIAVEAGVLLGVAFAVTKNIWLPIGLHFAWNFCEGPVFGTQVSGSVFFSSMVSAHVSGPNWLTGGAFGPEAGAPAIITSIGLSVALLARARASSRLTPEPVGTGEL